MPTQERIPELRPDAALPHTTTLSVEKALALEQILGHYGLPFRVVAGEGAKYPDGDGRVPKGAAFVTYDTGEIPTDFIDRWVERIAPTPMVDGRRA